MTDKLGFLLHQEGEDLVLVMDQEFLDTCGTGKWSPLIHQRYPGPYRRLVIDLEHCKIVQSTVFAEMLHLRDLYQESAREGVFLRNPNKRILSVLQIMHIDTLFQFV